MRNGGGQLCNADVLCEACISEIVADRNRHGSRYAAEAEAKQQIVSYHIAWLLANAEQRVPTAMIKR